MAKICQRQYGETRYKDRFRNRVASPPLYPETVVLLIEAWSARSLKADVMPFVIAIAIGASAGFATPFGYQTNLMVYGPGGYKFTDYLRVGIPLDLVFMAVTVTLTPIVFPF
jgi:di/tricarboxylate transporter